MTARVLAMPGKSLTVRPPRVAGAAPRDTLTVAFLRAAIRLGLSEKEMAGRLQISEQTWSKQKANTEHHYLQVQKFDRLPAAEHELFRRALVDELCRELGLVVVRRAGHLAHLAEAMRHVGDALDQIAGTGHSPAVGEGGL